MNLESVQLQVARIATNKGIYIPRNNIVPKKWDRKIIVSMWGFGLFSLARCLKSKAISPNILPTTNLDSIKSMTPSYQPLPRFI